VLQPAALMPDACHRLPVRRGQPADTVKTVRPHAGCRQNPHASPTSVALYNPDTRQIGASPVAQVVRARRARVPVLLLLRQRRPSRPPLHSLGVEVGDGS
jgi:hypothetical protein